MQNYAIIMHSYRCIVKNVLYYHKKKNFSEYE